MSKVLMGPSTLLYPTPIVLVGAKVGDKPNFMAVAWCGICNSNPPMVAVGIQHRRHTHIGILQNLTFSVNIPSVDLVKEVDYCGSISGAKVDKVEVCQFAVFYGKLESAPLIEQCPVNLECKVVHILDLGSHSLFVGRIEETHVSEDCLSDERPDIDKINPLAYVAAPSRRYHSLGGVVAKAFSVRRESKAGE